MKKRFKAMLVSAMFFLASSCAHQNAGIMEDEVLGVNPREGVALIITGAAARISQETALLEELDRRGILKDLVFISGDSSGALNAVMLNGVLSGRITWNQYKDILFNLGNADIFLRSGRRLPVDTSPARKLYTRIVEDALGYNTIGDLPFATSISITRLEDLGLRRTAYRMCSRKINEESDLSLSLVDILMATSSVPVVFPPAKIAGAATIPDVEYVDGGAGEDYLPYTALLEFEKHRGRGVDKVYIISRKSDSVPALSDELRELGVDDRELFNKLGISFDALANRKFLERLETYRKEAPELAERTYVWRPEFEENYLLFDFSCLSEQYLSTSKWAATNDPVSLAEYLATRVEKR